MDTITPTIPTTPTSALEPVREYLRRLRLALLHPTRFFHEEFPSLSTSEALAFGVVSAWLASVVAFFLQTFNLFLMSQVFDRWMQRLMAAEESMGMAGISGSSFLWSAGILVLGPFLYVLRILVSSISVFAFCRLFIEDDAGAPEAVGFATVLRIEASAASAHWYQVVPFFGPLLAFVAGVVISVTGVRERFRVSTRRAAMAVLAPYFLMVLLASFLLLLVAIAIFQLPLSEMLESSLSSPRPWAP